jgi:mono/diheme cytochrome c family protein
VAAGRAVFAGAGCAACHTLADAGARGRVGPNLDSAKPSASLVVQRVTNGQGAMPPFGGRLSDRQIADVAAYVSTVAGK